MGKPVKQIKHESDIRDRKIEVIHTGLEMVSNGSLMLESYSVFLEQLGGQQAIDIAAKLNQQVNSLNKVLEPMKGKIKSEALEREPNRDEVKSFGMYYMAVITRSVRSVTDNDALAGLLAKFKQVIPKKDQPITQIAFKVKQ